MPGYDRTGPWGRGPLTGRGLGPCRRGLGWRRGFGRDYGFRVRPLTKEEEKEILKAEKEALEQDIADIKEKLEELK